LPADVGVRIVADRGFGDRKLYRVLTEELKFDFVIRFRGNIMVTAADGEARAAAEWVGAVGYPVGTVVCAQAVWASFSSVKSVMMPMAPI
jgi:hypothetical protein